MQCNKKKHAIFKVREKNGRHRQMPPCSQLKPVIVMWSKERCSQPGFKSKYCFCSKKFAIFKNAPFRFLFFVGVKLFKNPQSACFLQIEILFVEIEKRCVSFCVYEASTSLKMSSTVRVRVLKSLGTLFQKIFFESNFIYTKSSTVHAKFTWTRNWLSRLASLLSPWKSASSTSLDSTHPQNLVCPGNEVQTYKISRFCTS